MKDVYDSLSNGLKEKFARIRFLVLDFDGTLTDNKVYVDQSGKETVMADRGDGLGLEYLRKHSDVGVFILSKETNPVTSARAKKLGIECRQDADDKESEFRMLLEDKVVSEDQVCFVGNDLNDIGCIKMAGLGIAVADAYQQVSAAADYITGRPGGSGAVREVCELIMYAKGVHPFP